MNNKNGWLDLAWQSVTDPQAAAPIIVRAPMDPAVLPLSLGLVAVLNGILYALVLPQGFLPPLLSSPFVLALLVGVVVAGGAGVVTGIGRAFGGVGDFATILRVMLWVQVLRLVAQVVVSLVEFASPMLALLAGTAAGVWGIYMLVCLVSAAHEFETRTKALAVLTLAFVAGVLALSVLLAMTGSGPQDAAI